MFTRSTVVCMCQFEQCKNVEEKVTVANFYIRGFSQVDINVNVVVHSCDPSLALTTLHFTPSHWHTYANYSHNHSLTLSTQ